MVIGSWLRTTVVIWVASCPFSTNRRSSWGTSSTGPAEDCWSAVACPSTSTGSKAPATVSVVDWPEAEVVSRFSAACSCSETRPEFGSTAMSSRSRVGRLYSAWVMAARSLAATSWEVICHCSTMQSAKTTARDSASVLTTMRSCMERRHSDSNWRHLCAANSRTRPTERHTSRPRRVHMLTATVPPRPPLHGLRGSQRPPRSGRRCGAVVLSRRAGLVADTADGEHDLGSLRVSLDFGPQSLDVHVDQPGVRCVPVAPDLFEQHFPGEDLAGLAGQRHQQVELQRSQLDRLAVAGDFVPRDVDGDVADGEDLSGFGVGATQTGTQPGDELFGFERFDDV